MSVAAVVLAAGAGTRFTASGGTGHKLLADLGGRTVLDRVLETVVATHLPVAVVSGATDLRDRVPSEVTLLANDRWAEGIATSVQVAVRWAEAEGHHALVVGLADQPAVTTATWATLAALPSDPSGPPIAVATYDGRRGNPVRLAAAVWPLLPDSGDEGARSLLRERPELVREVPCSGHAWDVDTVEDLERWS
jgi:CTP:molybdopterin cytidylyltransferase MocA